MKEEKFKVIQLIRDLVVAIDKDMANYPKKDAEIKNRIRTNTYDILELSYKANISTDSDYKKKVIFDIIAKIKVIDFLLNLSLDKQLITSKRYCSLGRRLDDIAKYTNGWLKALT